jgi:hypothetical protein
MSHLPLTGTSWGAIGPLPPRTELSGARRHVVDFGRGWMSTELWQRPQRPTWLLTTVCAPLRGSEHSAHTNFERAHRLRTQTKLRLLGPALEVDGDDVRGAELRVTSANGVHQLVSDTGDAGRTKGGEGSPRLRPQ